MAGIDNSKYYFPYLPPPPPHHPWSPPPPHHFPSPPKAPPPPPHDAPVPPKAPPPPPSPAATPPPPPSHPHPLPPPPHIAPPAPGHHSTVIIVFVSLGGLFFLAFLSVALCCFIKRRKKKTIHQAENMKIDEHVKVQETVVPGSHGNQTVILLEEDLHIQEDVRKTDIEIVNGHPHIKSLQNHPPSTNIAAVSSGSSNHNQNC